MLHTIQQCNASNTHVDPKPKTQKSRITGFKLRSSPDQKEPIRGLGLCGLRREGCKQKTIPNDTPHSI